MRYHGELEDQHLFFSDYSACNKDLAIGLVNEQKRLNPLTEYIPWLPRGAGWSLEDLYNFDLWLRSGAAYIEYRNRSKRPIHFLLSKRTSM